MNRQTKNRINTMTKIENRKVFIIYPNTRCLVTFLTDVFFAGKNIGSDSF